MEYEIITLGYNCQPRTYLTYNELIPTKKAGRKTMVFDLNFHPTKSVTYVLNNDFLDYFENFEYDFYEPFGNNNWQIKKLKIIFNHDNDCKENEFEKIKNRYQRRINNFKEAINTDKFLFFVHSPDETATIEDINDLYKTLKRIITPLRSSRGQPIFGSFIQIPGCNKLQLSE